MEGSVAAYILIMGNKPKQIMELESTCVFFFFCDLEEFLQQLHTH